MNKDKKDLLVFGYGLGVISALFCTSGYIKHGFHLPQLTLLVCGIFVVFVTSINPYALKLAYTLWMKVAHCIGFVITTGILSILFFLIFTPIGLLFRVIGKDHLDKKIDQKATSYWRKRPQKAFRQEDYLQQF